jgi:hypothetical protein
LQQSLKTINGKQNYTYVKIFYVRFIHKILIGINGNYKISKIILLNVQNFMKKELCFNSDSIQIINFRTQSVFFLNYIFSPFYFWIITKQYKYVKKMRINLKRNTIKILQNLFQKGFIRKRISYKNHTKLVFRGTFKNNLIKFDHVNIIKFYNSIIKRIFCYFNFVENEKAVT